MFEMGKAEEDAVISVLRSKQLMRCRGGEGGWTDQFEENLKDKFKAGNVATVTSGTAALITAMAALGVGPGDEVIVPAYTWVASALAPLAVGAIPVLADVDETLTLDPNDLELKITEYTKAIIPVHMINLPCNMDAIMAIARKRNLLVCEDACQAMGVLYKNKRLGTIGDAGAYSFNQFKNISCGEGGALVTSDAKTYARALLFHDIGAFTRNYAASIKEPFFPGVNYRVSEIQGAILVEQLKRLDKILLDIQNKRRIMAEILSQTDKFKIVKHNDDDSAVGLAIIFNTKEEALAFKEKHDRGLLINSGYHVYTNWEPLRGKRCFHPEMNPFNWAHRTIEYNEDTCPRTLDILSRSMQIPIPYQATEDEIRSIAEKLVL